MEDLVRGIQSTSTGSDAVRSFALEQDVRAAVAAIDFRLYFQPIVSMTDLRVRAVEALLRWGRSGVMKHEPVRFIPMAEETGLIVPLGAWTIGEAVRARQAIGVDSGVTVNVNLSARQLAEPGLATSIRAELAGYDLRPEALAFEVTETAAICDVDLAIRIIGDIRSLGCSVGIDDFGSGFASLAYLRRLPVNFMKLDRSFVNELGRDPCADALVEAMVVLARGLGIAVVAEGVETQQQHARLLEIGCTYAQGFFYARPQPSLADALKVSPARRCGGSGVAISGRKRRERCLADALEQFRL